MRDLRSLPQPVLERIARAQKEQGAKDEPIPGVDLVTTFRGRPIRLEERRRPIELRAAEDGSPIIEGYASVTEVWYEVWGGPPWGWNEKIARGAFGRALERPDDCRMLVNHDGVPIARTKSGTLELAEDKIGLHCVTPRGVDLKNPTVQELVSSMERSDMDEMSFAFTVDVDDDGFRMEKWNEDWTERTITGVVLYDVAVVTYPANPATMAVVRGDPPPATSGMSLELALALAEALDL